MWIRTLPVYSQLAGSDEIPAEVAARQPEGWRLSLHQVQTYKALTTGDADVIFDTAMTGDGKSLAGLLPSLIHGWQFATLAMYPTNELINDQDGQLAKAAQEWGATLQCERLNSSRLDSIMAEGDYTQRGDALLGLIRGNDVVLTNPDVFHLVMHQFYLRPADAPDKIIGPLVNRVRQFTFDEFHIFGTPQVTSVLNALLFIHEMATQARRHRFLFLSATPGDLMLEHLRRSGLIVKEVSGSYLHGPTAPPPDLWRPILREATVHFDTCHVEEWVEEHLGDILLPFFRARRPGAKGAIIVNSVAAAYRLLRCLRPALAEHGLTVAPNTGLTSRARRADSYAADLLIGTSTVDVGVDFQINFLVFESRDAGSFLQRLGRLGRHPGYERGGHFHRFEEFVAYALVPQWVAEALFTGRDTAPGLLQQGAEIDRERLSTAIRDAYPPVTNLEGYTRLWGELQSVRVMIGLSRKTIRHQYAQTRQALWQRYEATFGIRLRAAYARYLDLTQNHPALLREATAFRGGSYFTCGVIDETDQAEGAADRIKTADLFQLIAGAELGFLEEEEFYALAEHAGLRRRLFQRHEPLAFFRLRDWRQERHDYRLQLDRDIRGWAVDRFGRALALKGFKIDAQVPGLADINNRLCRRELPALLCLGHQPMELKRRLRLPLLFALYPFGSLDGAQGSVAFGREALLLEAGLQRTHLECGGGALIV